MASDILTIQSYLFNGLLSCDLFQKFNITLEREFLMQSEIEFNAIWQSPRSGQSVTGIGALVEMPRLQIPKPNSLQRNLVVSIGVIEERNINMTAGAGTGVSAEELSELALDFMFGWMLGLTSGLTPEAAAIDKALDLVQGADSGLIAYRASVSLRREHRATSRCDAPSITDNGNGSYTLSNGANTPDATIYYTVDGSFPGKSNGAAHAYAGAVAPASGAVLNWAAWRSDRLPSHVQSRTIT